MAEEVKEVEEVKTEAKAEESSVTAPVNPLERKVEISVAKADVEAATEKKLRQYAKTARVDGFRRGHVPMNMVRAMYGQDAYMEALNQLVSAAADKAIAEGGYRLAGAPEVRDSEQAPAEGDADMKFAVVFEVMPEVPAPDYAALSLKRYTCEVTEKEVESTLEVMRKQRAEYAEVERASQKDDEVTVDFEGKIDGVAFEGGSAKDFTFLLGSGQMLNEFDVAATGLAKGETKEFKLTFPENYGKADIAGKEADFTVTMKKVAEPKLPALDNEFAKSLGIEDGDNSVAKLKSEVEANLKREVKSRLTARTKEGVYSALIDAVKVDLPKAMIQRECEQMADEYRQEMARRGIDMKPEQINLGNFAAAAERRVHLGLILVNLINENKLSGSDEEIRAYAAELAGAYEQPAEVVDWYMNNQAMRAQLSQAVSENKLVDFVLEKAGAADEAVEFDRLMGRAA